MVRFKYPAQIGKDTWIKEAPERTRKRPVTTFLDWQYQQLISQMSGECVRVNRRFDVCTNARKRERHIQPEFLLGVDDGCQPVSLPDITPRKIDDRRQARKVPAPIGRRAHERLQKIQFADVEKRARIND
jgi:hypothetical protein